MPKKPSYHFHFRGEIPLLYIDTVMVGTPYLEVDYLYIFDPHLKVVAGFLSDEGVIEARKLGEKKLLENPAWKEIFSQSEQYLAAIENLSQPSFNGEQFMEWWGQFVGICQGIIGTYFYCEAPVLVALEERSKEPEVYKILEYIGQYKLATHTQLSKMEQLVGEVLSEISSQLSLTLEEVQFLTGSELFALLKDELSTEFVLKKIKERQAGFIYLVKNKKILIGNDYQGWHKKLLPQLEKPEVKGRVAYGEGGVVRGKARIHFAFSKTMELNPGDILVCGMTNPQMIPYLKQATAIVTDEGGLLCHAAIISRELKIPCIVGTKRASTIFQEGDMLEIDLKTGIICLEKQSL